MSSLHGKLVQNLEAAKEPLQLGARRHEQTQQVFEVVRTRHGQAVLVEERFQVLLGCLLAVKTNKVMHGRAGASFRAPR